MKVSGTFKSAGLLSDDQRYAALNQKAVNYSITDFTSSPEFVTLFLFISRIVYMPLF